MKRGSPDFCKGKYSDPSLTTSQVDDDSNNDDDKDDDADDDDAAPDGDSQVAPLSGGAVVRLIWVIKENIPGQSGLNDVASLTVVVRSLVLGGV